MTKNVSVIDESGKLIGTTYPKRAKGLVKSGRARYVSCETEDTICLTCPPDIMEDNKMTDNRNSIEETVFDSNVFDQDVTENDLKESSTAASTSAGSPALSAEYALRMLETIATDTEAIKDAIAKVSGPDNDLAQIIEAREKTNRDLIAFYTAMYNEHKSSAQIKESNTVTRFKEISSMLKGLNRNDYDDDVWDMLVDAAEMQLTRNY